MHLCLVCCCLRQLWTWGLEKTNASPSKALKKHDLGQHQWCYPSSETKPIANVPGRPHRKQLDDQPAHGGCSRLCYYLVSCIPRTYVIKTSSTLQMYHLVRILQLSLFFLRNRATDQYLYQNCLQEEKQLSSHNFHLDPLMKNMGV